MTRPNASLSLDLDNEWSYMKTRGLEGWTSWPSYIDVVTPHILQLCDDLDLTISVFIVGQDAALPANGESLGILGASRHEIGNHSFHHEPWLHLKSRSEIHDELSAAHEAITNATGKAPTGFRGPGYSLSKGTLGTLQDLGYEYDCTTFPTFTGPLARAYYFRTSNLKDSQRAERTRLFGTASEVFRPIKPYSWDLGDGQELVELPVTTLPVLRVPIHISYILYMSTMSPKIAELYFRSALRMCRIAGVEPSILVHPLDLLGGDEVESLAFFPAMNLPGARKRELVAGYLSRMSSQFNVLPMADHVRAVAAGGLKTRQPTLPN